MERYGHQIVIGNDLNRRKFEVVFVARTSSTATSTAASISSSTTASEDEITQTWLHLDPKLAGGTKEIEEDIIAELVKRHDKWVEAKVAT